MTTIRGRVIAQMATMLCAEALGHPIRVAVDGITASGKSTLARELRTAIEACGRTAIHISMDGFHHPQDHRYRQGRNSAVGYYDDAYDFQALRQLVLLPLGPGGDRRYVERIIDLASDTPVTPSIKEAPPDAVLMVDGTFLQRPELIDCWDQRIFVNTSFEVARRRGTARDAAALGGTLRARAAYDIRYHGACRLYVERVNPAARATMVFDNDDIGAPTLRRQAG